MPKLKKRKVTLFVREHNVPADENLIAQADVSTFDEADDFLMKNGCLADPKDITDILKNWDQGHFFIER